MPVSSQTLHAVGIAYAEQLLNSERVVITYAVCLAIGRIHQAPVVANGKLEPAWVLPVSLAFDHLVVDGVPALSLLRRRPRNSKARMKKPPAVMKKTGRIPI